MTRALRTLAVAFFLGAALAVPPAVAQVAPPPRGWIGVSYEILTAQEGARIRTMSLVTDVMDGSPAAGAGIRPGDILVSINGKDWEDQFGQGAPALRPGDAVRLVLERDGRRREVRLVAGTRPAEHAEAGSVTVTVIPDSIVERLYYAMDSLRIRIVEEGGLRERIAEIQVAADSMVRRMGGDRVVRLRRSTPGQTMVIAPFEPPAPDSATGLVVPRAPFPFGFKVLRTPAGDSLTVLAEEGLTFNWSAVERPGQVFEFRPTVPYVLGENRVAGAEVVDVRPELAEYFGVERGVLVVDVAPGTPAARAGIQPGDVLTHVHDAPLGSIADLRRGLTRAAPELEVTLVRKGKSLQVVLRR